MAITENKNKVSSLAKDFGMQSKDIIAILKDYTEAPKGCLLYTSSIIKVWEMPRSFSSIARAAKISSHFMEISSVLFMIK